MIGYLASEKFLPELLKELNNVKEVHGQLVLTEGPVQETVWAQHIWLDVHKVSFESISQAAKALKGLGKLWAHLPSSHHRRAQLIQDNLPKLKPRVLDFLGELPESNLGAWTLIDNNTLIASPVTNSPLPLGIVEFNEDKKTPPSRAYLKLWEFFTLSNIKPLPGQKVVDFGSCPGGWTWVLQTMGCEVISLDRAPLVDSIMNLPRVKFIKTNAFTVKPEDIGPIDWFYSDIICYPMKLYELILSWQKSGLCKNFVCTIKFQGETDFAALELFKKIPHSRILHLYNNKHEVTIVISPEFLAE